ncbi:MAG TPA: hypothetical protein VD969_14255 [Symbiobacteriaceae bacterium]|nr:hypothetical protein [Symbiobacteriaceae bacterium]
MRRSLRKIDTQEVGNYSEADQLFTVQSLEEARQRLTKEGLDPASFCFFTWMREGVRYYRVWEDKKLKEGIVRIVPFGDVAARLKRADAEKLYTVAKRYTGTKIQFEAYDGLLQIAEAGTGELKMAVSVPLVGGSVVFEPRSWNERQAAHFVNVILVRGQTPDVAFAEAESMLVASNK